MTSCSMAQTMVLTMTSHDLGGTAATHDLCHVPRFHTLTFLPRNRLLSFFVLTAPHNLNLKPQAELERIASLSVPLRQLRLKRATGLALAGPARA